MLIAGVALAACFAPIGFDAAVAALVAAVPDRRHPHLRAAVPALCLCRAQPHRRAAGGAQRHLADVGRAVLGAGCCGERLSRARGRRPRHRRRRRRAGHAARGRRASSPRCPALAARSAPRSATASPPPTCGAGRSDVPSRGMAVGTPGRRRRAARCRCSPLWPPAADADAASSPRACWRSAWSAARSPTCSTSGWSPTSAPTGALTVTYLIPIFGVLWGALFLGETRFAAPCWAARCWCSSAPFFVLRK